MLGFMETEKEFIKNWEKYRGAAGCLRYLAYWFLFGIIVIPLMLTAINPDIWSTVRMDQLAEEAATFFGLGFWLCILPSLLIGLGTWDKKNRKYKYLLRMAGNFLAGIGIALTAGGFFLKRKKQ